MQDSYIADEATQQLVGFMDKLSPVNRRKAMREIAQYLRKENRFRIRSQQNADGTRYAPRSKKWKKKGKMLQGFAKRMQAKWDIDYAVVGVGGRLAPIHHSGQEEKGIKYPSRMIIGLPEKDKQAVMKILLKYLELDKI